MNPNDVFARVGDTVLWRGFWGRDPEQPAKVVSMDVTSMPHEKYGVKVEACTVAEWEQDRVIFTLDNGHWAYAGQIRRATDPVGGEVYPFHPD